MNSQQILLVQASWPLLTAHADVLAERFYARLFQIDASAAHLFAGVDMTAQRDKLTRSLSVIVTTLDDPSRLLPVVAGLGKRHTGYGVQHRHFDSVGEALLGAIEDSLGGGTPPDLREAWAEAYRLVASVMRRALIRAEIIPGMSDASDGPTATACTAAHRQNDRASQS